MQPRSQREGIEGLRDGRLVVRVNAPPVDDRANAAVIELVAREFGVARSAVTLTQGGKSRSKTLSLPRPDALPGWFARIAAPSGSL